MYGIYDGKEMPIEVVLRNQFLDYLDEFFPPYRFGDAEYPPSRVLEEVDVNLFNLVFSDWMTAQEEDAAYSKRMAEQESWADCEVE